MDANSIATVSLQNRNPIQFISEAQLALEQANDIYEMRLIASAAEAAALMAEREGLESLAQSAKVLQLKADRAMGRWLKQNVNHNGGNPNWYDYQGLPDGFDKKESYNLQLEASLPEEKFNTWVSDRIKDGKELTASALRGVAKNYKKGIDTSETITFDVMKTRALYWIMCILKTYPELFSELIHDIIYLRKNSK